LKAFWVLVVVGNCPLFFHQGPFCARQNRMQRQAQSQMAGLRRSLCRLVAVELKLDGFDAAHKGLIELYIFSNSEDRYCGLIC